MAELATDRPGQRARREPRSNTRASNASVAGLPNVCQRPSVLARDDAGRMDSRRSRGTSASKAKTSRRPLFSAHGGMSTTRFHLER